MQTKHVRGVSQVAAVRQGDDRAYDSLVGRYQDMAVALAVSRVGDYHLAQDAVQEAFVEGFHCIHSLRSPEAFPGWFRKIVVKHCDRMTRRKRLPTVPLESVSNLESCEADPVQALEDRELRARIGRAIERLPEQERLLVLLLYMGRHSYQEVSEFSGLPLSTVKSRLHSARLRLKGDLITMLEEDLYAVRPSRNEAFVSRIRESIGPAVASLNAGDGAKPPGPTFNPFPIGHPVADVWINILMWAIDSKSMTFELLPTDSGTVLACVHDGLTTRIISVPGVLQVPLVKRFKAGADLDMQDRTSAQSGEMPVYDSRDDTHYIMTVSTIPTDTGEKVCVRIARSLPSETE